MLYRDRIEFGMMKHYNFCHLDVTNYTGTVGEFYSSMKAKDWISEKCAKTTSLSLRLLLHELSDVSDKINLQIFSSDHASAGI